MRATRALQFLLLFLALCLASCSQRTAQLRIPSNGDEAVDTALRAYYLNDFQGSVIHFEQALVLGTDKHRETDVCERLGHSYRELNRLDKAILTYRQWLELDPNSSTAWMHLGLVYRDSGDLDEAERCLTEAIRCSPEKAEIHAVLGALYLMKNFPERAVTTLRDAIGLDPNLALAHANISLAFGEMGRLEEAEDSYSIAVDLGYADANMLRAKLNHLAKAE